jgi:hypothetical protein
MKRVVNSVGFVIVVAILCTSGSFGQHRKVVVVRTHPVRRPLVVRVNHPIHRALPREVVVHPARRAVVVHQPLVYLPALTWRAAVVTLPAQERLVWQDSETISQDEGWVDTNFGIDSSGNALFLNLDGKAKLNFAEVTFANGQVQVVDFSEQTRDAGVYKLLDFADGRHVSTVRILAKSESSDAKLTVYVSKS